MKKNIVLFFLIACFFSVSGQKAGEWLALTPISLEAPALSSVKNVDGKVFTDDMLLEYSGLNVEQMIPVAGKNENVSRELKWDKARMEQDTITVPVQNRTTLYYYAVYLSNDQWIKGELKFHLFGNAEIYIDGQKKLTYGENKAADKSVSCELVPGKHTIIVKTISQGGKAFCCNFKPLTKGTENAVRFSISPERGKDIYDILNGKKIESAKLSPTGKYALIRMRETAGGKNSYTTTIYRVADKQVVYAVGNNMMSPQWVPGQDRISYLFKEGNGYSFYTYDIEKQQLNCLIREDSKLENYTWSPDLSYLIYYTSKNYGEKDWELRKLQGIEDRQPYYRYRSYLCKYDFSTGLHSRLTWGNLSTSLMDISHDGKQLIFSTSTPDYNEFPYSKQSIYLLNMTTQKIDTLWKDRLFSIFCSFSPDDKQLLISGGPSAFGKSGENIGNNPIVNQYDTQLYIYTLADGTVIPVTRDFNPSVSQSYWHTDGNIYLTAVDGDYVHLFRYNVKNKHIAQIECPGDIILSTSVPEKGNRMMYIASNVTYPPVIYTMNLNGLETAQWANPAKQQYEYIVFGEVKDWDYNYKKGTVIDGRYYLPADFDPNKKYPLIVYYYGGTTPVERSFGGRYPFNLYAANGYVVYVLQPSGTIGYGQEFSARHQNNWGKITGDEIINATKAFIKAHSFIDATKVGCMGASYGGFTTMYLTTHSDIFTCAISHAGISSLDGYWGDGYWGYTYSTNATAHAFPWNRKDIYVDQSPLFSADKAHNPILLIHGTKDVNVPTAQSMQFYTALKLLGKDVELVFVKDADHHVVDYKQRILWNNTIMAYFAKYLKGQPAWWENLYPEKNL